MLKWLLCFFLFASSAYGRQNPDSLADVRAEQALLDSLKIDSMIRNRDLTAPLMVRSRDSLQIQEYADSLRKSLFADFPWVKIALSNYKNNFQKVKYQEGKPLVRKDSWVLISLFTIILIFAIIKRAFEKQLWIIIQAFFSNRTLANMNKEENLLTSWPFILLFVLFGFNFGLISYLSVPQAQINLGGSGIQLFVNLAIGIILLYALKIVVLRGLGIFFNLQKPIGEYISILFVTYFNVSLVFLPLALIFTFSTESNLADFRLISSIILFVLFAFQLIRAGIMILSQNRFSKVYLFLYFCTLEICPILILIKAIGF